MSSPQSYQRLLATSRRVNWRLEDLIGGDRHLDFRRPFLPESFAHTQPLGFLSPAEKLKLNQIRARGYLGLFELVEAFIMPFVAGQASGDNSGRAEPLRTEALRNFVSEEEKHRRLFSAVIREFDAVFGVECGLIGPAEDICRGILAHGPLAITIAILGLEWMSQGHYLGAVKDNQELDPQFKSLLKHHWIEEAQHARLDALVLESLAHGSSAEDIGTAIQEYLEIGAFLDAGLGQQAELDLHSLERAIGRRLSEHERRQFLDVQHQGLRWTFLGSAMKNRNFLAVLGSISGEAAKRVELAAKSFVPH